MFAITNTIAALWTYIYLPESGGRSFEMNQKFFEAAADEGSWRVSRVRQGTWRHMPYPKPDGRHGESQPLLQRIRDQV